VAYAEVVGDDAICLETGQVLFRFGGGEDDGAGGYQGVAGFKRPFDFSPPMGKRHPDDKGVDVLNMVKAGILTDEDVANPFLLEQGVVDREHGPARIAEHDFDAEIDKRLDEDFGSGHFGRHWMFLCCGAVRLGI
jgi:hypothetical protein